MTFRKTYGITKEQYDALMEGRTRPLTDDGVRLREIPDTPHDGLTPLERIIAEAIAEDRRNRND